MGKLHFVQASSRTPAAQLSSALAAAGRWEVRIGLKGSKHVYLGLHSSEVDAAKVYDRALVLLTGQAAATNFPSMQYTTELAEHEECAPWTLPCKPQGFFGHPCCNKATPKNTHLPSWRECRAL